MLIRPPDFSLTDWRVFEVPLSPSDEAPTLHLVGWATSHARVSSPIFGIDPVMRACQTRSGNIYQFVGNPARKLDVQVTTLWQEWKLINGISSQKEVTDQIVLMFQRSNKQFGIWGKGLPPFFPRDCFLGAVPGEQLKFLARRIDGHYVVGPTEEELRERYELCMRLSIQYHCLYLDQVQQASPNAEFTPQLAEMFVREALKGWDLSAQEREWIIDKTASMR
ncbi:hypothetical protein H0A66_18470 [Alcaligenaceae bacterium]|nr:hypothetical protein [Alcaligenaceae bacterium]